MQDFMDGGKSRQMQFRLIWLAVLVQYLETKPAQEEITLA
jgi:hypothetical protein